jgi:hypothetical protein
MSESLYVTAREFAALANVSLCTLDRRMAENAWLPPLRTNGKATGHRRWLRTDAIAWLEQGQPSLREWRYLRPKHTHFQRT